MLNLLTNLSDKRSARVRLETILRETSAENSPEFTPTEHSFLLNILALRDLHVEDIMVPRADIIGLDSSSTVGEAMGKISENGYSRLPVYRDNLDDPAGFIHVKDLVKFLIPTSDKGGDSKSIDNLMFVTLDKANLVHDALYVPPSMPVLDLFLIMQTTRNHLALIIDEYGGTHGLATIEDIVEAVVGEIDDEHDEINVTRIKRLGPGSFLVNGRVELEELRETLGQEAPEAFPDVEEDVDTLGGLLVTLAGHVPVRGEVLSLGDSHECKVIDADPRRVKMVSLYRVTHDEEPYELGNKHGDSTAQKEKVSPGEEGDTIKDQSSPSDNQTESPAA